MSEKSKKQWKYRATFTVGHKPDGTPIRKDIKENNKRAFDAKCRYYKNLHAKGVNVVGKGLTVEEWGTKWLETYKKNKVGPSQYRNYEINLRLHIYPKVGFMDIASVKAYHLQEVLNDCSHMSKSNVSKISSTLSQIFEQAEINGMIEYNPARRLILTSMEENHRRALTEKEQSTLMEVATTHRAGLWVRLMLQCGLRRGETVPLRWSDIDFDSKLLRVNKSVEFASGNQGKEKSTKTESGNRIIPIPDDLFIEFETLKPEKDGFIFTNANGARMTSIKVRRMWEGFCREWDIELGAKLYRNKIIEHALDQNISPHYLRHTYATNLRRLGVDLKTAQYLLGHADIRTTGNIYSHVDEEDVIKIRDSHFTKKEKADVEKDSNIK